MNVYYLTTISIIAIVIIVGGFLYLRYAPKVGPNIAYDGERIFANYGTAVSYQKDTPILFKDFSIKFTGTEPRTPDPQKTITFFDSTYLVSDYNGKKQTITVTSGQLPPEPMPFVVGEKHFTLFTSKTPKGERLEKEQIFITYNPTFFSGGKI